MKTNESFRRWIVVSVATSLLLLAAPNAMAQNGGGGGAFGASVTTTTTGVATTLIGGGIALTVILVSNSSDSSSKEKYIRQNAVALKQDLTVGAGETVQDLAATFQVEDEDRETFARMLRERRDTLVPLTNLEKLDADRADRFFQTIVRGMQARAALRDDLREISFVVTEG